MKIIDQSYILETDKSDLRQLTKKIEKAARTCYKSEKKIEDGSDITLVKKLIISGHEAMLEHAFITVRFITDRGVTHELVRHRLASFGQESTRYVKYNGDTEFIRPVFDWGNIQSISKDIQGNFAKKLDTFRVWTHMMKVSEEAYKVMLDLGASPQEARSILPNSLKTEIVVTANIREWRHIFKLRTATAAHPQIRKLMIPLLEELKELVPVLFADI